MTLAPWVAPETVVWWKRDRQPSDPEPVTFAIETSGLCKHFGPVRAVDDLTLRVEQGEVFGFLGPNGGGKSTTIKVLLDIIRPTSGSARILGYDVHDDMLEVHRRVGYLPGELVLPSDLTAAEYLSFLAKLRVGSDLVLAAALCDRLDLDSSRRLGQLSTGNRQKVGLVQAFMHRPELVVLDEPTTGLDPLVQHEVHELFASAAAEGTTVFLSSHVLSEVDRVADRVGVIRSGRLVAVDTVPGLKRRARSRIDIEFDTVPTLASLADVAGVRSVALDGTVVTVVVEGSADPVLRRSLALGTVVAIRAPDADLEDVFLEFYREPDVAGAGR